jgi:hypothetical protein
MRIEVFYRISNQVSSLTCLAALLMSLNPVSLAHYDSVVSPPGCLEGTRMSVLSEMISWVKEPKSTFSIYWLAGLAGTGKSTIAKTFCERIAGHDGFVLLTFFASKSSAERRNPFRMLHTFVHQLATVDQVFCEHLLKALRESGGQIITRPLAEQVERLLKTPLATCAEILSGRRSLILVVDALDECTRINNVEGYGLIPQLTKALQQYPIKLVVTSRMESDISEMFRSIAAPFFLHQIADDVVAGDVQLILLQGFANICSKQNISQPWPSEDDMLTLIRLTGHLLIFASTVIRFVGARRFDAHDRLRKIMERATTPANESPYREIDLLYLEILISAVQNERGQVEESLCNRLRLLLGVVVILQQPLNIDAIASLTGVPGHLLDGDVRALSSVLLVDNSDDENVRPVVRLFHPSMRDFMLERCDDPRFSVKTSQPHHDLALRCLVLLNDHLHEDICNICDPTLLNSEVGDLDHRLHNRVPSAVRYACVHWVTHLKTAIEERPRLELAEALLTFSREHLLHWVELLSLQGQMSYAFQLLPQIISWCQVSS